MNVSLYFINELQDNGITDLYRDVTAKIDEENRLVFSCWDINQTARDFYGGYFGVEFYLILNERSKDKLAAILHNRKVFFAFGINLKYSNKSLLEKIEKKFGGRYSCFEDIMKFLKNHNIHYEYQRW